MSKSINKTKVSVHGATDVPEQGCYIGDWFVDKRDDPDSPNRDVYVLVAVGPDRHVALINVRNGCRVTNPIQTCHSRIDKPLLPDEWERVAGYDPDAYVKVKNVAIAYDFE
jgi:hypothetical protein